MAGDGRCTRRAGGLFWRLTLRTLRLNRTRTLVSVLGIVLSSALITAVFTTVTSLSGSMYQDALTTEGSWYVWSDAASDATVAALVADERVSAVATAHELGCALLDTAARERAANSNLAVMELPMARKGSDAQAAALMRLPRLVEGRMPRTSQEIVLNARLRGVTLVAGEPVGKDVAGDWGVQGVSGASSEGPLALGSTITLDLGTRTYDDGEPTGACEGRRSDEATGGWQASHLEHVQRHSYTVVGFRLPQEDLFGTNYAASGDAVVGITCAEAVDAWDGLPTARSVWACCDGYTSLEELQEAMRAAFFQQDERPAARLVGQRFVYHDTLLRYAGMIEHGEAFVGLWIVAAVLVVVIVLASVSLIYTSFAISVSERSREFGLLASLGASRRQLRRMVLVEALLLGAVGIPVGMASGVAGVAVALRLTGEGFRYLLDLSGGINVHVSAVVLLGVAALSVLTLLASAGVPALRASRIAPVEAVRQVRDVRIGHRARREIASAQRRGLLPVRVAALPSLAARVAGVPGFVAHRNLSRASSRGWVIALSLAVSFALFVTSGVIGRYLNRVDDAANNRGASVQGDVMVHLSQNGGDAQALRDEARLVSDALSAVPHTELISCEYNTYLSVRIPHEMVSAALRATAARENALLGGGELEDDELENDTLGRHYDSAGDYVGGTTVRLADDATWQRLCDEAGVDPWERGCALALNVYLSSILDQPGRHVAAVEPFAATGEVDAYQLRDGSPERWYELMAHEGDAVFYEHVEDDEGVTTVREASPNEAVEESWVLLVRGLTKTFTEGMGYHGAAHYYPVLVMSERMLDENPGLAINSCLLSVQTTEGDAVASCLEELDALGNGDVSLYWDDVSGGMRQARAVAWMLRVFATLFAVITMLIALANAFNTLTTSIMLRTREFAVLRSAGMGPAAFRRMIACECASYAMRGMCGGMVLSLLVDAGLWRGFNLSMNETPFTVPWDYVALAVVGVVAMLGASVAFALRKSRATSIVDGLRQDVS